MIAESATRAQTADLIVAGDPLAPTGSVAPERLAPYRPSISTGCRLESTVARHLRLARHWSSRTRRPSTRLHAVVFPTTPRRQPDTDSDRAWSSAWSSGRAENDEPGGSAPGEPLRRGPLWPSAACTGWTRRDLDHASRRAATAPARDTSSSWCWHSSSASSRASPPCCSVWRSTRVSSPAVRVGPHGRRFALFAVPPLVSLITGVLLVKVFPGVRGSGVPQTEAAYHLSAASFRARADRASSSPACSASDRGIRWAAKARRCRSAPAWRHDRPVDASCRRSGCRDLVPVGAAGALAAAFNTPVAAVLFALEEIIGDMNAPLHRLDGRRLGRVGRSSNAHAGQRAAVPRAHLPPGAPGGAGRLRGARDPRRARLRVVLQGTARRPPRPFSGCRRARASFSRRSAA